MALRWIFGLPGAALMTALLFLAMAAMIKRDAEIVDPVPPFKYSITATGELSDPVKTKPVRPKPIDPPPVIERNPPVKTTMPGGVPTGVLPGPEVKPGTIDLPTAGSFQYKTTPPYPQACLARGAHGVVIVEFDVTPEGSVVNPRIISSPDSCFDRTVLREVLRWRYTPRSDGGRAVMQRGVRAAVNFQLTE
ncbi:MAG: TonB family protein [Parvularculaceae bacterium]